MNLNNIHQYIEDNMGHINIEDNRNVFEAITSDMFKNINGLYENIMVAYKQLMEKRDGNSIQGK